MFDIDMSDEYIPACSYTDGEGDKVTISRRLGSPRLVINSSSLVVIPIATLNEMIAYLQVKGDESLEGF